MLILRINEIFVGLLLAGYASIIIFLERYNLASFFMDEEKSEKHLKKYALRLGRVFLLGGVWLVLAGMFSFVLSDLLTMIQLGVSILLIILLAVRAAR